MSTNQAAGSISEYQGDVISLFLSNILQGTTWSRGTESEHGRQRRNFFSKHFGRIPRKATLLFGLQLPDNGGDVMIRTIYNYLFARQV